MNSANLTRDETAARSAAITVHRIGVELDVTEAGDPARTGFSTTTTVEFDATTDATWLDFLGESVTAVWVNGEERPVQWDGARISLTGLAASNRVMVQATGAYSRSGEGMHRFVDPADGEPYLYTQYEPADSRRVMACFEQPDMKARYTFTVHAPAAWEVLSNQSVQKAVTQGETQIVTFAETLPISSYITCVVAGPYHRVRADAEVYGQRIDLGVLCRASLAPHLDADEIVEITRQGLDFFTEAFGYDYPWGKYDQIFVPEYNLGAMENPGLVTFTEAYVFRGAATEAQREARANTILHEMAHMWFGDLVTMRWWDDLWLKESFADYMGAHASARATRFTEAWTSFANRRKAWAYAQDQLPTTHPIVADIVDLEAAKLNFDGITYAKGAAVLKQLVAHVGEDAFFAAARRYFAAHAFGTATMDDLFAELEAESGRELAAWADAWLRSSGVSTVWTEADAAGGLVLVQDPPRPQTLRVGEYALREGALIRTWQHELRLDAARTPLAVSDADLVLLNDDDLSYVKVRLDARSLATVEAALTALPDSLARGVIWSALWNATRDGELPAARYLAIVRAHAGAETNIGLLTAALANVAFAVQNYVRDGERADQARVWLAATWAGLHAAAPGSGEQLAWARALAEAAAFDDARAAEIQGFLAGMAVPEGLPLDADLRWQFVVALAATGHASDADIDAEAARDATAAGRTAAVRARAALPVAAVRAGAWAAAWNDLSLTNDHLDATIAGFRAGGRRDLIAGFDEEYFARILPAWHERSIELARRLVVGLFPASDSLDAADRWLAQHADAPAALRRLILEQRDQLARALRVRAAQPSA